MLFRSLALPAKTVKDLIALAKAKPGELNYGASAPGTTSHLAAELFKSMAGVNIVRITYKGNTSALNDVLAGHLHLTFAPAGAVAQHVKSGKVRALGVTNAQPSPTYPDIPTIAAAGLPGFEAESIYGLWVPAKTPNAIVNRLNQEIVRALHQPEIKDRVANFAMEVVGSTPEFFAEKIKGEVARMGRLVREVGIRDE